MRRFFANAQNDKKRDGSVFCDRRNSSFVSFPRFFLSFPRKRESRILRSRHRRNTPTKIININPYIYLSGVKKTILSLLNKRIFKMKLWIPNQVGDDMLLGSPIKDFGDDTSPQSSWGSVFCDRRNSSFVSFPRKRESMIKNWSGSPIKLGMTCYLDPR